MQIPTSSTSMHLGVKMNHRYAVTSKQPFNIDWMIISILKRTAGKRLYINGLTIITEY